MKTFTPLITILFATLIATSAFAQSAGTSERSDVWGKYIATIIAEDQPTIRAVNPTTWIKSTNYPEPEFAPSFRAFAKQRAELLALLRALPKAGWARSATVTGAGRPRERTVLDYARWLANHERSHVKHIERMINSPTVRPRNGTSAR